MKLSSSLCKWLPFALILFYTLLMMDVQASSPKTGCVLKARVCVDGPSTKIINSVPVHKECWEYQNKYQCLEANAADYCTPLQQPAAKCEVQGQDCLEKNEDGLCLRYTRSYSCDVDVKTLHSSKLPENITELPPTHLITSDWDTSQCDAHGGNCQVVNTQCIEGKETRVINGVAVTQDCWKQEKTLQCNTGEVENQCKEYEENDKCQLKKEECIFTANDGSCQIIEKTYICTEQEAGQKTVSSCEDRDFAKTMTTMEMAREMQRFYDPANFRFFNGEANQCSIKLGGKFNKVLGGSCCKTKADPSKMKDFVTQMGTQIAAQYLMTSVASHYTYTTMFVNSAAQSLGTALSAAGGITGVSEIGAFGFSATGAGNLGTIVQFNPATFAAAIAVMALQKWMKCSQPEILTAMKRKANLCHYIGSYCDKKILGVCVKKIEVQCCYVSKLAKIVSIGGKAQLGRDFGSAKNPNCEGFTAQELEAIDFSKLDMSEFYADIVARMENVSKQGNAAIERAKENVKKGAQEVKNYYEQ